MGLFRRFQYAKGSGKVLIAVPFKVAIGDCDNIPNIYTTVYLGVAEEQPLPSEPSAGNTLFTDINLTQVYNGGGNTHRLMYNIDMGIEFLSTKLYTISSEGLIQFPVTLCQLVGIENLSIINNVDAPEYSCWELNVLIPEGQNRELTITKIGQGLYHDQIQFIGGCDITGGMVIVNNMVLNMGEGIHKIIVGIRCLKGDETGITTIFASLEGGNSLQLTRNHSLPPTF